MKSQEELHKMEKEREEIKLQLIDAIYYNKEEVAIKLLQNHPEIINSCVNTYSGSSSNSRIPFVVLANQQQLPGLVKEIVNHKDFSPDTQLMSSTRANFQTEVTLTSLLIHFLEKKEFDLAATMISKNCYYQVAKEVFIQGSNEYISRTNGMDFIINAGNESVMLALVNNWRCEAKDKNQVFDFALKHDKNNLVTTLIDRKDFTIPNASYPALLNHAVKYDMQELAQKLMDKPEISFAPVSYASALAYAAQQNKPEIIITILQRTDLKLDENSAMTLYKALSVLPDEQHKLLMETVAKNPEAVLGLSKLYQEMNDIDSFVELVKKNGIADQVMLEAAKQQKMNIIEKLVEFDGTPFSINAETDGKTILSFYAQDQKMKEQLFDKGYLPRNDELLPQNKAAEQDLKHIATSEHGASNEGIEKEATSFYIKETLDTVKKTPEELQQATVDLSKKLQVLQKDIANNNFTNVPQELLAMNDTIKKDVFRDYYLEGKEGKGKNGGLTEEQLQDLFERFGDNQKAATEIINKLAAFVPNIAQNDIVLAGIHDTLTPSQIIGAVSLLQVETLDKQNDIELLKELYMSATAYGTDLEKPSCLPGTVQRVTNAAFSLRPEFHKKYDEIQSGIKDRITENNVTALANSMANELIKSEIELSPHVQDYVLGTKTMYGDKDNRMDQKLQQEVNQSFKKHIKEVMPEFGDRLPTKQEMEILTTAITGSSVATEYRNKWNKLEQEKQLNQVNINDPEADYKKNQEELKTIIKRITKIEDVIKKTDKEIENDFMKEKNIEFIKSTVKFSVLEKYKEQFQNQELPKEIEKKIKEEINERVNERIKQGIADEKNGIQEFKKEKAPVLQELTQKAQKLKDKIAEYEQQQQPKKQESAKMIADAQSAQDNKRDPEQRSNRFAELYPKKERASSVSQPKIEPVSYKEKINAERSSSQTNISASKKF